jgi:mannosyltransferase
VSQTRAGSRAGATAVTGRGSVRRSRGLAAIAAWYWPAAAAAAVMTVFGLWGLVRDNSMGNDEVTTRYAAMLSLHQLAHLLGNVDAVHGTYYLFMHAWIALGSTATVLRVPSLIAMVAAAAMVAITGTRLTGSPWAGLFSGLIMAMTPSISYYTQTARSYALVLACVVAATLALMRVLRAEESAGGGPHLRMWVLYGALMTVASYLNEMALLVLAAHAVTVLLARHGRRVFEHFVLTAVVTGVLVAPLLLLSVRERAAIGWIGRPGFHELGILFHDYFGGKTLVSLIIFAFAVAAVLPPRGWQWRQWRKGIRDGAGPEDATAAWWERSGVSLPSVALPLLVLPAGLLFAESLVTHPLYVDRYVLYGEAGAALLAGGGCYRVGQWLVHQAGPRLRGVAARRALLVIPGVVACLCALLLNLSTQDKIRLPQRSQFDFGSASFYLGAHARDGDGVLFINSFFRKARYGYPADFRNITDLTMAQTPQQAGTFNGTDKPFASVQPLMLSYQRIWTVGNAPSATLASTQMRNESMLLMRDFRLAGHQHFAGITVTLWVRQ